MSIFRLALSLAIACLLTTPAWAGVKQGVYVGSSQTTVKFLNPNTLQVVATKQYTRKLTVTIGAPKTNGGFTESNPFTLIIAPTTPGALPVNGDLYVASARGATQQGIPTLLLYWQLQSTQAGFGGSMIDNHYLENEAKDRVVAPIFIPSGAPTPHKLHSNATSPSGLTSINGIALGKQLTVTIKGFAFVPNQAIIKITTKITAKRP